MRTVSSRYLMAIANPVKRVAEVTITLPGETTAIPVDIEPGDCTVTMSGSDNSRYSASITLSPSHPDAFDLAGVPGAEFRIRAGVDYGLNAVEWVDMGVYYTADGDRDVALGDFPITLQDGALRLDECDFSEPWGIASDTDRASAIQDLVLDATPGLTVINTATPAMMAGAVFDRERLGAIEEIANGGSLDAAFDAAGAFVIRDMPMLTSARPVWIVKSGEQGTILPGARRQIPFTKLFNRVVVGAPEPFQTWGAVTVDIADPTHPRAVAKIGPRPFRVSDSTITSRDQAVARGRATLRRILTVTEEISVPTLGNAALEYGDTIAVIHQATEVDPGLAANYFVEAWTFNLGTGAMDITGRSTDQPALEESA